MTQLTTSSAGSLSTTPTNISVPKIYSLTFENTVVRKDQDIESQAPEFPKAIHEASDTKQLLALQKEATTGLDKKISMMKYDQLTMKGDISMFQKDVSNTT